MEAFTNTKNLSLLNEAQERSLLVTLRLLEEELFIIQLLAENGNYEGKLYSLEIDHNEKQRQLLQSEIQIILSHIHKLKKRFGLKAKTERLSKRLRGVESYYWSVLRDQRSGKLKQYGAISTELPGVLDPVLDQIMDGLRKIVEVIEEDSGAADGQGKRNKVKSSK